MTEKNRHEVACKIMLIKINSMEIIEELTIFYQRKIVNILF